MRTLVRVSNGRESVAAIFNGAVSAQDIVHTRTMLIDEAIAHELLDPEKVALAMSRWRSTRSRVVLTDIVRGWNGRTALVHSVFVKPNDNLDEWRS